MTFDMFDKVEVDGKGAARGTEMWRRSNTEPKGRGKNQLELRKYESSIVAERS